MTALRVLLLFPHITAPGGALVYTQELAMELQRRGATVAVLTLRENKKAGLFSPDIKVLSLQGPLTSSIWYWLFFPMWQQKLNKLISEWQPDVIVPQVFPANWWGWLFKKKHPATRLVWICQEPSAFIHSVAWIKALTPWWKSRLATTLRPLLSRIDISLSRQCNAIVANSSFTASAIKEVYGITPSVIAPPGINIFDQADITSKKERIVLSVARLTKFKRIDFLLEVFVGLLEFHPDLTYHIAGSGEEEQRLRQLAESMGLGTKVVFHGAISDSSLRELYRRACLFMHGSRGEPFGLAPLEAIASGTPVIAHMSGGVTEFVDQHCGVLVDSTSPDRWAKDASVLTDKFFSDSDFRSSISACAHKYQWSETLKPAIAAIDIIAKDQHP